MGMINLRGRLIPVIDLHLRFQLQQRETTRKSRIVVVEFRDTLVGLLVDQVTQVLNLSTRQMESPPDHISQVDNKFIRSICNLQERLIIVLELDFVLKQQELEEISEIA